MSKKQIDGKKSIKDMHSDLGFGELPSSYSPVGTGLDIDTALKKELKEAGLVYRFLNFKIYKQKGFHQSHWKPYQRKSNPSGGVSFTVDPDGYTVHQDLVLGVKPAEWNKAHKEFLSKKSGRLANAQKIAEDAMKEAVAESGGQVISGYEENS